MAVARAEKESKRKLKAEKAKQDALEAELAREGESDDDDTGFPDDDDDDDAGADGTSDDDDDDDENFGLSKEDQLEMAQSEHAAAIQAGLEIMGSTATDYTVAYQTECNAPGTAAARDAFEVVADEIKAGTVGPIVTNTDPDALHEDEAGAVVFFDATQADGGDAGGGAAAAKPGGLKHELLQPLPKGVNLKKKPALFMLKTRQGFRKAMIKVDKLLQKMAELSNAMLEKGPEKNDKRWINKAKISYHNNLRRVTDIARRCLICENFDDLCRLVEMLRDSAFVIVRIKNRFKKGNDLAEDTASYRDCQLVCFIPGTKMLFEIQLHLRCIYDVKAAATNETGADGRTGHQKYIVFRDIKERADATLASELKRISLLP